ncbi:vWA domain-containing protein [Aliarcobacter cryaerophilus]|uniref:vWA domain-containing protein n=1 Tax=Aliarcobacter cryaerophilus TaxID=28198 RepID=UPI003DA35AB8
MKEEFILRQEELIENPTPRVPICLCLDVSGSMNGNPLEEMAKGVEMFFDAIKADEIAKYSAEISIVTFGGVAKKSLDFMAIERQEIPEFYADGATPMGEAVNLALDLLEHRKEEYKRSGVDYFQPWLVIMTDGEPTDDISSAVSRLSELVFAKKISIFPIAIGNTNTDNLAKLSPTRPPLRLKGLNFKEFFIWLGKSVSRVSHSTPGETVNLDVNGIHSWAQI